MEEEQKPLLIEESLKSSLTHTEQTAAERSTERKELRDHHGKKRKGQGAFHHVTVMQE